MAKAKSVVRILNCLPSRKVEDHWQVVNARGAGLMAATPSPPKSVDHRAAWWKIGDQLDTGSRVSWAAADFVLRWHLAKNLPLASTKYSYMTITVKLVLLLCCLGGMASPVSADKGDTKDKAAKESVATPKPDKVVDKTKPEKPPAKDNPSKTPEKPSVDKAKPSKEKAETPKLDKAVDKAKPEKPPAKDNPSKTPEKPPVDKAKAGKEAKEKADRDKSLVDNVAGAVSERITRNAEDAGHIAQGNFTRVSEKTKSEIAEALKDSFEGRTRSPTIDLGNGKSVYGERRPDGSIHVFFNKNF